MKAYTSWHEKQNDTLKKTASSGNPQNIFLHIKSLESPKFFQSKQANS